ncbi:LysR family transcriptional regulator ArgP [Halioxenophilus sp. WMMB6]|uniref:LysR family transcriptional regulator ArgP n=1 Tax=Halioxenophilus sp. WMMB6 TaxID=3073815 RepID=UPI00295F2D2E|nr:LysR family transcriptional regulator ArgP [Halioxenophilus sp. WMMB6]
MKLVNRHLQALAKVLETASFEQAASQLHISQSAVSQRIKQLEQQLGQTLLVRSTPPQPTAMGQRLMHFYRQAQLLEAEVFQSEAEPWQTLTIGINADSLATWFFGAVEAFVKREGLLLDLRVDDQDETLRFLRAGEVSGAVSAEAKTIAGCDAFALGTMTYHCVGTPGFAQHYFAEGANKAGFLAAPALHYSPKDQLQANFLARNWQIRTSDYAYHQIPSTQSYLDFILRGLAWGLVPELQCQAHLASGRLVKLTPDTPVQVPLYWHTWTVKSELLRRLTRQLQAYCSKELR